VHKWYGERDAVMRDRRSNREHGIIGPGINLQEEHEKDIRSEGDNGCARKAPMERGKEALKSSYVLEMRGQLAGSTGRPSG
jgi:hypothetical protein